jgi:hypothetical protein
MAFQKVEEPAAGTYIGWGNKAKQFVEGKVLEYDETGGSDYAKKPCPLLEVELTKRAASFNKEGERTNYDPGEVVMLTCGLANLKKYIKKVAREGLKRGNLIRIELVGFENVPDGKVKIFEIQVDRSHEDTATDDHDSGGDDQDDEPPF